MTGEQIYGMWCDSASRVWPRPKGFAYTMIGESPPPKPVAWQFLSPPEARAWAELGRWVTVADVAEAPDGQ